MKKENEKKFKGLYPREKDTKNFGVFKVSSKTKDPAVLKIYVTKEFAGDCKKMKLILIPVE